GGVAGRCGEVRPGAVLLDLAARDQTDLAAAGQGPEPFAESGADLRHLRTADVLPHLRARRLSRGTQTLSPLGKDPAYGEWLREGDRDRYLARSGHATGRTAAAQGGRACRAARRDGRRTA